MRVPISTWIELTFIYLYIYIYIYIYKCFDRIGLVFMGSLLGQFKMGPSRLVIRDLKLHWNYTG